jgi:hypothetical protein
MMIGPGGLLLVVLVELVDRPLATHSQPPKGLKKWHKFLFFLKEREFLVKKK